MGWGGVTWNGVRWGGMEWDGGGMVWYGMGWDGPKSLTAIDRVIDRGQNCFTIAGSVPKKKKVFSTHTYKKLRYVFCSKIPTGHRKKEMGRLQKKQKDRVQDNQLFIYLFFWKTRGKYYYLKLLFNFCFLEVKCAGHRKIRERSQKKHITQKQRSQKIMDKSGKQRKQKSHTKTK